MLLFCWPMFKHKQKKKLILLSYFVRKQIHLMFIAKKPVHNKQRQTTTHASYSHKYWKKKKYSKMQHNSCKKMNAYLQTTASTCKANFLSWKSHKKMVPVMDCYHPVMDAIFWFWMWGMVDSPRCSQFWK